MSSTSERTLTREYGGELCRVVTGATEFHPVALHFGGAVVILQASEALMMAHALVDAVCQLNPKKRRTV